VRPGGKHERGSDKPRVWGSYGNSVSFVFQAVEEQWNTFRHYVLRKRGDLRFLIFASTMQLGLTEVMASFQVCIPFFAPPLTWHGTEMFRHSYLRILFLSMSNVELTGAARLYAQRPY